MQILSQAIRRTTMVIRSCKVQHIIYISQRMYTSRNILKLKERGLWDDVFPQSKVNELIKELKAQPQTIYSGFDPTADSLHLGNLLVLISLLHCQRAGHNVIALVGGATGQVGDPSGRDSERPPITNSQVEENERKIKENIHRIFENHKRYFWDSEQKDALPPPRIVNNASWYRSLSVVEFLGIVGRSLRMGDLLSRTSVQSRIKSHEGLSFLEFSYQALQAYDWLHLYDQYNCTIQIGGSDQMGNIYTGYYLIRSQRDASVSGLTLPLITSKSGAKWGKSSGTPVWLDNSKTTAFDFYQFFLRQEDLEIERYLYLFTFIPAEAIEDIMIKHRKNPESRHAQKKLAEKVTLLVHGLEGLESAQRTTRVLYGNQPDALEQMTSEEIESLFASASSSSFLLEPGTSVLNMAIKAGCFPNEFRGRHIIEAGGLYVNLSRVTNPDLILIPGVHILRNGITLIRVGKKNYYLVKWLNYEE